MYSVWNLVKYNQSYSQMCIVCCFLLKKRSTPLDGLHSNGLHSSETFYFITLIFFDT